MCLKDIKPYVCSMYSQRMKVLQALKGLSGDLLKLVVLKHSVWECVRQKESIMVQSRLKKRTVTGNQIKEDTN